MPFLLPLFSSCGHFVSLHKRITGSWTYLFLTETPSLNFLVILTAEDWYFHNNRIFCCHENVRLSLYLNTVSRWLIRNSRFVVDTMYIFNSCSTPWSSLPREELSVQPLDRWFGGCYNRSGGSKEDKISVPQQEIDPNFVFVANGSL
jgi:hypothetical protein